MTKKENLQRLTESLDRLTAILRLDPTCQWTRKFETDLALSRGLLERELSESEIHDLAISIMHVFQGSGSFNDYAPATYDSATGRYRPIPGAEEFEKTANEVFDLAQQLRKGMSRI